MQELTFTIKVVCCLAGCGHLVTPQFLLDLEASVNSRSRDLPNPARYVPPIAEPSLRNLEHLFSPQESRKSLFSGKTFVFLAPKQLKRMKQAITLAGGSIILKDTPNSVLVSDVSSNQVIFVQAEDKDVSLMKMETRSFMEDVYTKLKSHNLRTVRESEIGLAILHNSLKLHCNPATSAAVPLLGSTHSQFLADSMLPESQMSCVSEVKASVFPENVPRTVNQALQSQRHKRKIGDSVLDSLLEENFSTPKRSKCQDEDGGVGLDTSQIERATRQLVDQLPVASGVDASCFSSSHVFHKVPETPKSSVVGYDPSGKSPLFVAETPVAAPKFDPFRRALNETMAGFKGSAVTTQPVVLANESFEIDEGPVKSARPIKPPARSQKSESHSGFIATVSSEHGMCPTSPYDVMATDTNTSVVAGRLTGPPLCASTSRSFVQDTLFNFSQSDGMDQDEDPFAMPEVRKPGSKTSSHQLKISAIVQNILRGSKDSHSGYSESASLKIPALGGAKKRQGNGCVASTSTQLSEEFGFAGNSGSSELAKEPAPKRRLVGSHDELLPSSESRESATKITAADSHRRLEMCVRDDAPDSNLLSESRDNADLLVRPLVTIAERTSASSPVGGFRIKESIHSSVDGHTVGDDSDRALEQRDAITPGGFISMLHKKSDVRHKEPDPDIGDVPDRLIVTAFVSLVARAGRSKSKNGPRLAFSCGAPAVKNYKKFTKVPFRGIAKHSGRIISVNDLSAFKSENVRRDTLFDELREVYDEEARERKAEESLFNWDSRGKSTKRR